MIQRLKILVEPIFNRLCEAKATASLNPTFFFIHLWIYGVVGFSISLISLGYSHSACFSKIEPSQIFNLHFAFNASIFIGAVFHSNLSRRLPIKYVIASSNLLLAACFSLLPFASRHFILLCTIFTVLGISIGISISSITVSFTTHFKQQSYLLVHFLHFTAAFGSIIAAIIFQSSPEEHRNNCESRRNPLLHTGPHIPSLEKFYMNPGLNPDYIHYFVGLLQIPLLVLICRADFSVPLKSSISIRRSDYSDIEQNNNNNNRRVVHQENAQSLTQHSDVTSLKLVLLCSLVASIANIMYTLFPFLILAQPGTSIFHYQMFSFGCMLGCCLIASEQLLLVGSLVFGFFLSPLLPTLVTYINQGLSLKSNNTFLLISGYCSGNVIFPLLLTLTTSPNSRLFIAFNFVAIVLLVIILVSILSLHAQIERMQASQSGLNLFVSRFLSGESLLKRTRSIRPLISRLRPNSYRRFANRRGHTPRSPSPAPPSPIPQVEITVTAQEVNRLNLDPKGHLTPTRV